MKKEVKSQAALEFLTTYAWAFLVIMITIGTLYYFGIFDFSKFLPQKCVFPSQFECIDFSFDADEIRFRLVNNLGEEISVSNIDITDDASNPLACVGPPPPNVNCGTMDEPVPFTWGVGKQCDFTFAGCAGGSYIVKERAEAKISITYCAPDTEFCPPHTVNGKITAVVT